MTRRRDRPDQPDQPDWLAGVLAGPSALFVYGTLLFADVARALIGRVPDLDEAAEKYIRSQGAVPSFKGYRGLPGSICTSPNSMVVHGIPGPYELRRGDILSIDVGVTHEGWVADAAITVPIGEEPAAAQPLLGATQDALFEGIAQAEPATASTATTLLATTATVTIPPIVGRRRTCPGRCGRCR